MVRFLTAAALAFALAACSESTMPSGKKGDSSTEPNAAAVPADAIAVGDDVYMVPAGVDSDGCAMFRVFSPTKMVVQAVHYRAADGTFVMDKVEAACDG